VISATSDWSCAAIPFRLSPRVTSSEGARRGAGARGQVAAGERRRGGREPPDAPAEDARQGDAGQGREPEDDDHRDDHPLAHDRELGREARHLPGRRDRPLALPVDVELGDRRDGGLVVEGRALVQDERRRLGQQRQLRRGLGGGVHEDPLDVHAHLGAGLGAQLGDELAQLVLGDRVREARIASGGAHVAGQLLSVALGAVAAHARLEGRQHHQQDREARRHAHGQEGAHQPALQAEDPASGHTRASSPPNA
jgi:hypothetical protein